MNRRLWDVQTTITLVTAFVVVSLFVVCKQFLFKKPDVEKTVKVGFIYEGDESTPYTNNFILSLYEIEKELGNRLQVEVLTNVSENSIVADLQTLVDNGCDLIFTTSYEYSVAAKDAARKYPSVQFCQATGDNANIEPVCKNYHTFMGEIYQGRYISGLVAGLKLKELISSGEMDETQMKIGYVAAYPYAEVISGYTAFLLGIRSVVPSATMIVRYTNTWNNYSLEKICAQKLIDEGCVVISQHSDSIAPAVACEENYPVRTVYHVGYNQSMIDVAPLSSLISTKINWSPYMMGAIRAVMEEKSIESVIPGHVHGNDIGAGFEAGWVQMLELNDVIAAPGTSARIEKAIQAFKHKRLSVFSGSYTGVNPFNPQDVCNLRTEFEENAVSSAPRFCYVLDDIITVEE